MIFPHLHSTFVRWISGGTYCRAVLLLAMNISKAVDDSLSNLCSCCLNPAVWSLHTQVGRDITIAGIISIYNDIIFVALTGLNGKVPCLVGVHFVLNVGQGDKNMMGLYVSRFLEGMIILDCCRPGPCCFWSRWPLIVTNLVPWINFKAQSKVRPGHPQRYPCVMAHSHVDLAGEKKMAW